MDVLPTANEPNDVEFHAGQQKRQLALQAAAAFVVVSLAWPYYAMRGEDLPWPHAAFAIAAVALLLASLSHQRWWWRLIHAAFAPLAWSVSQLSIDLSFPRNFVCQG